MGARKFHGIIKAEYTTDSGTTYLEIKNIVQESSGVSYEEEPGETPKDVYGNNFRGPQIRTYGVSFSNRTDYEAVETLMEADTAVGWRFTLDNGETHTSSTDMRCEHLRPVDIQGAVQGRSDVWFLSVRFPSSAITQAAA